MEERFKIWLRICIKEKQLLPDEIEKIKMGDRDLAVKLFQDFCDYDKSAIADFVQVCMPWGKK